MSDTVFAALIGGFCSIIAAFISAKNPMKRKGNNWKRSLTAAAIVLFAVFASGLTGFSYYRGLQSRIVLPAGAREMQQAKRFEVDNHTVIKWIPDDVVMTVQTYRNDKLVKEYKNAQSGDSIVLGTDDTGAIEIKIWDEKRGKQLDQIWVWTKK